MFDFLKVTNSCDGRYSDSLDVRFTKKCDNDCSFCIEKKGLDSLGETNVDELVKSTILSGQTSILILGGEPFLEVDKLHEYISYIKYYAEEIFITTSIPETLDIFNPKVLEILNSITGLNVSLQHHDSIVNNRILNASNKFNRIDRLRTLLANEHFANKIRVSINLCKGAIDSQFKIDQFIDTMIKINCKHVKINELQNVDPDTYVSFEKKFNVKLKSPYAYGCQTDISHFFYNKLNVTLKRACFKVQDESIAKHNVSVPDLIKLIYRRFKPTKNNMKVLYEDGQLSDGWRIK